MSTLRGVVIGSFGLITLYNVVYQGQQKNTKGVDTLAAMPAAFANYLVNPAIPLIPNISGDTSGGLLGGLFGGGGGLSGSIAPGSLASTSTPATKSSATSGPI